MLDDAMTPFLAAHGWADAQVSPLAGDASNRRYSRVRHVDGRKAVLMDAPPSRGEDVRPFLEIAAFLRDCHLSAPKVFAQDDAQGLLLLEDLGDDLFARLLERAPDQEATLYRTATEVLWQLHQTPPPPNLERYDSTTMPELGALALDWYAHFGDRSADPDARKRICQSLETALAPFDTAPRVLAQRDYHAENLLWLPDRQGPARVGLLDFQDARAGHAAYDLVSLLEDARRDVEPATVTDCKARYMALSGSDPDTFEAAFATMGAQRNLRIIGVFARLSLHFGKPTYINLIPRVWAHLQTDLSHPHLSEVAKAVAPLPAPSDTHLQRLKDLCGTVPTR